MSASYQLCLQRNINSVIKYNLKILKLCTLGKLPKKLRLVLAQCNSKNSFFFSKISIFDEKLSLFESDSHKINRLIWTLTANISCATTNFLGSYHWKSLSCMNFFKIVTRFFFCFTSMKHKFQPWKYFRMKDATL